MINVFLSIIFLSSFSLPMYSMEQQLIVIRHGEAARNVENNSPTQEPRYTPFNLTEAGVQTVQKTARDLLAQGFSNKNIAAVFVSPLPRTRQTADILVQQGLVSKDKIILDKRLIQFNPGDLEDPAFGKDYHAESEEQIKKGIKEFYGSVLQQYTQGNIVVVTHALIARDLIEPIIHKTVKLNPGEAKVVPLRQ